MSLGMTVLGTPAGGAPSGTPQDRSAQPGGSLAGAGGSPSISAPSITLPTGGGAIRGIGEKFAANPVTGTGSMSVPLATSPGRSGFGPELALSYDSGAGNGLFGLGWSLSLPAITRKTDKGLPRYADALESDVFLLSGAEDLVPEFMKDAAGRWVVQDGEHVAHDQPRTVGDVTFAVRRYRPRAEGTFARIERWTSLDDAADVHWRSLTGDNILTIYGKDENSRIADPADPARIYSWLICETRDDKGNAVVYEYQPEDGAGVELAHAHECNRGEPGDHRRTANRYLKRVRYGNRVPLLDAAGQRPHSLTGGEISDAGWMFKVVFDYGEHDVDTPTPIDSGQWRHRVDAFSSYRGGFEVRTCRLCRRVLMFHHFAGEEGIGNDCLVRSTDFTYSAQEDPGGARAPVYTYLLGVTQSGYKRTGGGYLKRSLPPVEFGYSQPAGSQTVREVDAESLENLPIGLDGAAYQWIDLHGEGIPGILTEQGGAWFYKRNLSPISVGPGVSGAEHASARFAPMELVAVKPNLRIEGERAQFMDLAGDGQPDLVVLDGPMPGRYEHDGYEGWHPFRPFAARLNRDLADPNLRFVDLDGDGHADVLITEGDALVWHPSLAEKGFGPAHRITQAADEEKGPRLIFADGTQSIYLADLSGDGLTDLVRIRDGETCYWPNLGYGRFGAKVTMDHAPHFDHPDQFDHRRIRLADIDGTGTTDIIYLHRDGVRLYFNQSGNSWSEPQELPAFPRVDDLSSVMTADLLGNGTACLVWSSPLPGDARRQMRYLDLMGGQKPHLLVSVQNNLGAQTRIHYASSTKFYLQDRRDGRPWITRLPFPVHVVERVETYDHISRNRFVTRYSYHHGYFDGDEREFRGFGRVDQWDTEEFAALAGGDLPAGDNVDLASHVPPVLTRTWFHTGTFVRRDHISDFFAGLVEEGDLGEYYREPGMTDEMFRAQLLPDTHLPPGLSAAEEREACRALKGSVLRQEVYALDGSDSQPHPYSVSERDYTLRCLQPRGRNRHAVYFSHARETIDYHYERNPSDPRIAHSLALEVDDVGNVLKEAAIGYGRRTILRLVDDDGTVHQVPNAALDQLDPGDRQKQTDILVTYTEHEVTNAIDDDTAHPGSYRMPLPCQTRTYELTGYPPTGPAGRFQIADFVNPAAGGSTHLEHVVDSEIPYEGEPTGGRQRRLIEQVRTHYRPDDLGEGANDRLALLPLGTVQRLALPGESYQLALTPGLLAQVYQRPLELVPAPGAPETLLPDPAGTLGAPGPDGGGYVELDGDGRWWVPSGRVFFSPGGDDGPAQERGFARAHFFLPHRFRDPFHTDQASTETVVTYDDYHLLIQQTRDCLGNRVTVGQRDEDGNLISRGNDYRVLQPRLVTDPNGNLARSAFDALGLVVGTAVMGKPPPATVEGDSLDGFVADLTQAQVDAFHDADDPHLLAPGLLAEATTRIIYDVDRFRTTQEAHPEDPTKWQPGYAATLARETHASDPLPPHGLRVQVSFAYSDGFGREIQQKVQAEPGPAPVRDAAGRIVTGAGDQPEQTDHDVSPRWVGSGWTVFNNKDKPVRQYEPFFTDTHRFEFDVRIGVSPVLCYDPVGRVVATLHPDHIWEKVVFDPWREENWDVIDTVTRQPHHDADVKGFLLHPDGSARLPAAEYLPTWHALRTDPAHAAAASQRWPDPRTREAEQEAAQKAIVHAETPTIAHADALGRPFLTVAHNRFRYSDAPPADPPAEEWYQTRVRYDIEGNEREVVDAKQRVVMRYHYDVLGNRLHQASMEAGERWTVNDVAGNPIRAWDSRGHTLRTEYDPLRRPTGTYLREGTAAETLVGRTVYGESRPDPAADNLRGRVVETYDQAGVVTSDRYDFKGNLLWSQRQLAKEFRTTVDWSTGVVLQPDIYSSGTRYDALNRPIELTAPDSSVIRPGYNEANLLERVEANLRGGQQDSQPVWTPFVTNIDYDAKRQRSLIEYGNSASTTYEYDPFTFRLVHLLTRRGGTDFPDDCPQPAPSGWPGCQVQSLHYTYDPAGNLTHIRDDAQQTIFFKTMRVEPSADYTYDAIGRLIEATGREHVGQVGAEPTPHSHHDVPRTGLPHPGDGHAMARYLERYRYDAVGNFLQMQHRGTDPANPGWTRSYAYQEPSQLQASLPSNRMTSTTVGSTTETYSTGGDGYDAHGSMRRMPHLPALEWDFRDQLRASQRQAVGDGAEAERTWYVYDAAGQRVRKVTELAPGQVKDERIYLGGFEIYRRHGSSALVRETLHIMDDQQRIALVDTRTHGAEPGVPSLLRYQLGNHLGSVSLELDEQAQVISYEECSPYGSTTYQAGRTVTEVSGKRYRYTGKERDEETGLYYHGARYYAAWLGRWTSADPAGLADGHNLYQYVRGTPIRMHDPSGRQGQRAQPVRKGGLSVSPNSQITAQQWVDMINRSDKLTPWMKSVFKVEGNRIVNDPTRFRQVPQGEVVPEWFMQAVLAIELEEWHLTTGMTILKQRRGNQKTSVSTRLIADTEPGDYPVPSGRGVHRGLVLGETIPSESMKIMAGTTPVARKMLDDLAGGSKENPDRRRPRGQDQRGRERPAEGLIVVANRGRESKEAGTIEMRTEESMLETLFHELAAHASLSSQNIENEHGELPDGSAIDWRIAPITRADILAKEIWEFFGKPAEALKEIPPDTIWDLARKGGTVEGGAVRSKRETVWDRARKVGGSRK
jgi:RHS repeat-associated protein